MVVDEAAYTRWSDTIAARAGLFRHGNHESRSDEASHRRVIVRVSTGRGLLHPAVASLPGAPDQLDRERCAGGPRAMVCQSATEKSGRGQRQYDQHALANTGWRWRAWPTTRCWNRMCWNRTSRTTWTTSRGGMLNWKTVTFGPCRRQGRQSDRLRPGERRDGDGVFGRGCRRHVALASRAWPARLQSRPRLKVYASIEMPLVPVLAAWNARCADRCRACCASRVSSSASACWSCNSRPRQIGGRNSISTRPSNCRPSCSTNSACRAHKNTHRATFHQRRSAGSHRRRSRAARVILEYRGLGQTTLDLHRKAGRDRQSAHRPRAYQLSPGRSSDRTPQPNDPNLQNIPVRTEEGRRIRQAFIAPEGLRDSPRTTRRSSYASWRTCPATKVCCGPFTKVGDIHRATAAEVFGLEAGAGHRQPAPRCQSDQFRPDIWHERLRSRPAARRRSRRSQEYMERYFSRYPGVQAYMEATREGRIATATSKRCSVVACTCRKSSARNQQLRAGAERAAINAPMQGTAADIIKRAMIAVAAWLNDAARRAHADAGAR